MSAATIEHESKASEDCNLWTKPVNQTCKCGNDLNGTVKCEDGTGKGAFALSNCYCMTNTDGNQTLVGSCLFTCTLLNHTYYQLPTRVKSEINSKMCGPYERTGLMCSKCMENHSLPVYSYSLSCVQCNRSDFNSNLLRYTMAAYGPLTLLYICFVVFRTSATDGQLIAYVTISQMFTIRGFASWLANSNKQDHIKLIDKYLISFIAIWNIDFFRQFYAPFCLHPHLSVLHIFMLDYLVAFYPLMLIFLTYLVVKLHDRFVLVTWMCRPLYRCFHHFRKEWDIKTSLIGTFASFYLLSYVKVVNVTADILAPAVFLDMNGTVHKYAYYFNASLPYFREDHLPIALFAVFIAFIYNICPLILLLVYPCSCFHRCLNRTGCRCHTLHLFMDAMLGAYGHKPRERRYFGALYLLIRISHVTAFAILRPFTYLPVAVYIMIINIICVALFQPYKNVWHNRIDLFLFSTMVHIYLMLIFYQENLESSGGYDMLGSLFMHTLQIAIAISSLFFLIVLIKNVLPRKFIKRQLEKAHEIISRQLMNKPSKESTWPSERDRLM